MNKNELRGKIQTVLGLIAPDDLGITLPHEHLLLDMQFFFKEPPMASERFMAHQPVSLENLGWIRHHFLSSLDNIRLIDEEMAIREALRYKHAGGNSIVELTSIGMGRDPLALARISRATDLNIIMGTGYYLEETWPPNLTEEIMAKQMIRDITVGVDDTGIRAGIIGEVGTEMIGGVEAGYWQNISVKSSETLLTENYKMSLHATAYAQKETGAPVNIHPGHSPNLIFEIIEVLNQAGADISRVAMSHIERTIFDHNMRVELAKTGCYLEYDSFGFEGYHPVRHVLSEENPVKCDIPNDAGRVNEIIALIEEGFINQILVSADHCTKHLLWHYGGPGYAHILENVVPLIMRDKGMTEEQIHTILVENPKRLLQFV